MKKILFLLAFPLLVFSFFGCASVDVSLNENFDFTSIKNMSALTFNTQQKQYQLYGQLAADTFILEGMRGGKLSMIERGQLESVMKELKLGQTGFVDVKTAKEVGKVVGVDAMVIGTLTHVKHPPTSSGPGLITVHMTAKMIYVETGEVIWIATSSVEANDAQTAIQRNAKAIANSLRKKFKG